MSSDSGFIAYICEQTSGSGNLQAKKMFGEYLIYCNGKPALLVCDNTVYVKCLNEVAAVFERHGVDPQKGEPYKGAKPHYILDIDNRELSVEITKLLAKILPEPKKRKI